MVELRGADYSCNHWSRRRRRRRHPHPHPHHHRSASFVWSGFSEQGSYATHSEPA